MTDERRSEMRAERFVQEWVDEDPDEHSEYGDLLDRVTKLYEALDRITVAAKAVCDAEDARLAFLNDTGHGADAVQRDGDTLAACVLAMDALRAALTEEA
jgi:hypothetical protein